MDVTTLYDEDICAWAEQQAASLRRLAASRRDLPNELDLENIAEEIEDVGHAQRSAAESFIRMIFVHLIQLAAAPQAPSAKHWRAEITTFHNDLLFRLTPSMPWRIDLDRVWRLALKEARVRLQAEDVEPDRAFWEGLKERPIEFEALVPADFDVDAALEHFLARA